MMYNIEFVVLTVAILVYLTFYTTVTKEKRNHT